MKIGRLIIAIWAALMAICGAATLIEAVVPRPAWPFVIATVICLCLYGMTKIGESGWLE